MATLPRSVKFDVAVTAPNWVDIEQAQRFFYGEARGFGADKLPDVTSDDVEDLVDYWQSGIQKVFPRPVPPGAPPALSAALIATRLRLSELRRLAAGQPGGTAFPRPDDIWKAARDAALELSKNVRIKPIPWRAPVIDVGPRSPTGPGGFALLAAFAAGYYIKGN